jgi:hypothetical protein
VGVLVGVTVSPYEELSTYNAPDMVFSSSIVCTPVTAEIFVPALCVGFKGLVDGVNVPVYTATPLTIRALLIYPVTPYAAV